MVVICEAVSADMVWRTGVFDVDHALQLARRLHAMGRHKVWIERRSQPASQPTIATAQRWRVRTFNPPELN